MKLLKNDVLKLGHTFLRIREIKANRSFFEKSNEASEKSQNICKICFSEASEENSLITPCKCTGSVKFVHKSCLKEWLTTKIKIKEKIGFTYIKWRRMMCEICRTQYDCILSCMKYYFKQTLDLNSGNLLWLFLKDLERVQNHDFLILEKCLMDPFKIKGIYIVYLKTKKNFTIVKNPRFVKKILYTKGSGSHNDIVLKGKGISKNQMSLFYVESNLLVKDLNSEIGTFCLMKDEIFLDLESENSILVIGKNLFNFNSHKNSTNILKRLYFNFVFKYNVNNNDIVKKQIID